MNNLAHGLVQLCRHNRDGSYATQANRQNGLKSIANELYDLGYKLKSPKSIKPKHVDALVDHWHQIHISPATMKNRMGWVRWWAEKVDKASVVPRDNTELGIEPRKNGDVDRAWSLPDDITLPCPYADTSLRLMSAFGLRVEEALKIQPRVADGHVLLSLKGSWTKGGRPREIPISEEAQQQILHVAKCLAGNGSLIPAGKTFIQQRKKLEHQALKAGLRNLHGLRHAFAQRRYIELTGWHAPKAGGPAQAQLSDKQMKLDHWARKIISEELGHCRISITIVYLG